MRLVFLFLLLLFASRAFAQPAADGHTCDSDKVKFQDIIAACTAIIENSDNPRQRASAFHNRGNAYYEIARANFFSAGMREFGKDFGNASADLRHDLQTVRHSADVVSNAKEAIKNFNAAIAILGHTQYSAITFNSRAGAFHLLGNTSRALSDYAEAIRLRPNYADAYANRGITYDRIDYNKAVADLSRAISIDPRNTDYLSKRADHYRDMGKLDDALADYEKILKIDPKDDSALSSKKLLQDEIKDRDDQIVKNCVSVESASQGNVRVKNSCTYEIVVWSGFQDAAIKLPANSNALINWSILATGMAVSSDMLTAEIEVVCRALDQSCIKDEEAKLAANKAEQEKESQTPLAMCNNYTLSDSDRIKSCTDVINDKTTWTDIAYEALDNRRQAYEDAKQLDQAIADCNQMIKIKPTEAEPYELRAGLFEKKGDIDRALADYNEMIGVEPNEALPYQLRADLYKKKGDFDHAIADYNVVLRLNATPDDFVHRGDIYAAKGDFDHEIADYTSAIHSAESPYVGPYFVTRGDAYRGKGYFNDAVADYDSALVRCTECAGAYYGRSLIERARRNDKDADADLAKAKQINSDIVKDDPSPTGIEVSGPPGKGQ